MKSLLMNLLFPGTSKKHASDGLLHVRAPINGGCDAAGDHLVDVCRGRKVDELVFIGCTQTSSETQPPRSAGVDFYAEDSQIGHPHANVDLFSGSFLKRRRAISDYCNVLKFSVFLVSQRQCKNDYFK